MKDDGTAVETRLVSQQSERNTKRSVKSLFLFFSTSVDKLSRLESDARITEAELTNLLNS